MPASSTWAFETEFLVEVTQYRLYIRLSSTYRKRKEGIVLKFHVYRCVGISTLGIAAFFLAVMQGTYSWDVFFTYLLRDHADLLYGFIVSLIIAAVSLSIQPEKKE